MKLHVFIKKRKRKWDYMSWPKKILTTSLLLYNSNFHFYGVNWHMRHTTYCEKFTKELTGNRNRLGARTSSHNHKRSWLTSMTNARHFDIIKPLPQGKGQVKFTVIGIDYFEKWAEVEPLATITEKNIWNFVWNSIVCRFGIP